LEFESVGTNYVESAERAASSSEVKVFFTVSPTDFFMFVYLIEQVDLLLK
jgi:hypothetical protein